jgi:acyl-coenzyme A synthetase/AMP-(fatty) acid ligase
LTPSDALAQELLGFARDRLASFKTPRSLDFVAELPRTHPERSSGTGYARRSG